MRPFLLLGSEEMNWQILASAAGAILTLANLANILLSNKTRADISELKLWITEQRAKDDRDLRGWVDEEFVRKDVFEALRAGRKAA
jgi:hypothetical protein